MSADQQNKAWRVYAPDGGEAIRIARTRGEAAAMFFRYVQSDCEEISLRYIDFRAVRAPEHDAGARPFGGSCYCEVCRER